MRMIMILIAFVSLPIVAGVTRDENLNDRLTRIEILTNESVRLTEELYLESTTLTDSGTFLSSR